MKKCIKCISQPSALGVGIDGYDAEGHESDYRNVRCEPFRCIVVTD